MRESAEQRPRFIQTRKMGGVSVYFGRVLLGGRMRIWFYLRWEEKE